MKIFQVMFNFIIVNRLWVLGLRKLSPSVPAIYDENQRDSLVHRYKIEFYRSKGGKIW